MEFCSKYGYNYGFSGSDSEEYEETDEKTNNKVTKKTRKADTNIISVKFDKLVASNEMYAGEPKHCKNCSAILSALSNENVLMENNKLIWKCEFCEYTNENLVDDIDEIPKKDDVTFMLELPKPKEKESSITADELEITQGIQVDKEVSNDDGYLSFCIDISGSMDTVIPTDQAGKNTFTRLNGVKVACMETLKKLKEEEPSKRVSITTFSDIVNYFGDCTTNDGSPLLSIGGSSRNTNYGQPQQRSNLTNLSKMTITKGRKKYDSDSDDDNNVARGAFASNIIYSTRDDLENQERIITLANNLNGDVKGISHSYSSIMNKIKHLRTEGSTALGPALVFSIGFSAKKAGSSIILCTDGAANVGLGSIERDLGPDCQKFYDDIADYAKNKGVSVNVISMEGTDCKLALLGRVADRSNGQMSIVNPLNLSEEFKSILGNRVVATQVEAKLIVNHKYLYIRDEKVEAEELKVRNNPNDEAAKQALEALKQSIIIRSIGNANIDTEITFEYGIRKRKEDNKDNLKKMPFQLQITYVTQDGTKAIRVYTKILEFTTDRQEAEKNLIAEDIIYSHNAQVMSGQMLLSNIKATKTRGAAVENLILRNNILAPEMYSNFSSKVQTFQNDQQAYALNDEDADMAFKNAKMTRTKLTKKK